MFHVFSSYGWVIANVQQGHLFAPSPPVNCEASVQCVCVVLAQWCVQSRIKRCGVWWYFDSQCWPPSCCCRGCCRNIRRSTVLLSVPAPPAHRLLSPAQEGTPRRTAAPGLDPPRTTAPGGIWWESTLLVARTLGRGGAWVVLRGWEQDVLSAYWCLAKMRDKKFEGRSALNRKVWVTEIKNHSKSERPRLTKVYGKTQCWWPVGQTERSHQLIGKPVPSNLMHVCMYVCTQSAVVSLGECVSPVMNRRLYHVCERL